MKKLILWLILLAVIIIGGVILLNSSQKDTGLEKLNECMKIPITDSAYPGFLCITNVSVSSLNPSFCEKIKEYASNDYTNTNYNNCIGQVQVAQINSQDIPQTQKYALLCNNRIELSEMNDPIHDYSALYSSSEESSRSKETSSCGHVNYESFYNNNSQICSYLNNQKIKAICTGSAVTSINQYTVCDSFAQADKEFCLLNVLNKIYAAKKSLSPKETALNICGQMRGKDTEPICYGFVAKSFNDSSICNFQGEDQIICLKGYFNNNVNPAGTINNGLLVNPQAESLCKKFFTEDADLIKCLFYNAINVAPSRNVTEYGKRFEDSTIFSFVDFSDLSGKTIFLLSLMKKDESQPRVFSYVTTNYLCNSLFDSESSIPSSCTPMNDDRCFIIGNYCLSQSFHWTYQSFYS